MRRHVSVRLDGKIRSTLQDAAKERGVGLSTYLRDLAVAEAKRVRRARIRAQSRAVAAYVASSPAARAFFEDWGTPSRRCP